MDAPVRSSLYDWGVDRLVTGSGCEGCPLKHLSPISRPEPTFPPPVAQPRQPTPKAWPSAFLKRLLAANTTGGRPRHFFPAACVISMGGQRALPRRHLLAARPGPLAVSRSSKQHPACQCVRLILGVPAAPLHRVPWCTRAKLAGHRHASLVAPGDASRAMAMPSDTISAARFASE